jgi:hypothetical protein
MENRLRLPVLAASKLAPTLFDESNFTIESFRENHCFIEEDNRLGEFGIAPALPVKRHENKKWTIPYIGTEKRRPTRKGSDGGCRG